MHHHDLDIIMGLAQGTLDASEVPGAEAAIASCEQCRHDLDLQRQALAFLGTAPTVSMTDMESARIRRVLRDELELAARPAAPASTAQRRRRFGWGGALGAAAVLVVVVAVAPTLNLLGSGGDESASVTFAAAATTTTAAAAAAAPSEAAQEDGEDGEILGAGGADLQATTDAAGTATFLAPAELQDMSRLASGVVLEDLALSYRSDFTTPERVFTEPTAEDGTEPEICVDAGIALLNEEGLTIEAYDVAGLLDIGGEPTVVVAYQVADGDVIVLAMAPDSCEIIARA